MLREMFISEVSNLSVSEEASKKRERNTKKIKVGYKSRVNLSPGIDSRGQKQYSVLCKREVYNGSN